MAATTTLSNLVTRCLSYGYGDVDAEQFKIWLNQAYLEVAGAFKWDWLERVSTITTVKGLSYTELPSDLAFFGRLRPTDGRRAVPEFMDAMDMREYSPVREAYAGAAAAPRFFTLFGGRINWTPTPDAAYTYDLYHWYYPAPLTADTSVAVVPDMDADVLVIGALRNMAMRENDNAKMSLYTQQMQAALNQMMRNQKAKQQQKISRVKMPDSYGGRFDEDMTARSKWWLR